MPIRQGTAIGPYQVVGPLGAGGMGEVYRARDTRLGRDVAIKVLPPAFAADPDRLRRFEQEARATGMLNHPNLLAIFDLDTYEGSPCLVSELLEGRTLREYLNEGALPQRKAIEYGIQLAQGLAAAHEKGVVHRDLKPENIFITRDGRAKILDFGLAKVRAAVAGEGEPSDAGEATLSGETSAHTQAGVVLGSAGYMSPEQVRGKPADARSDIFGFGAILYEMLSGRRAFARESPAETMSAIAREDPPELTTAPGAAVSPAFERVVRQCLEKSPEHRFQSAHDVALALQCVSSASSPAAAVAAVAGPWRRPHWTLVAGAVAALAAALLLGAWLQSRRTAPPPEWSGALLGGASASTSPRISPDGRTLAFAANIAGLSQLAIMHAETGTWSVLTTDTTHGFVQTLCWSRDGSRIYFDRQTANPLGVYSVPAVGGAERLVLENAGGPEALPDGSLLVARINSARQTQAFHFVPETGALEPLPAIHAETSAVSRAVPGGREFIFYGNVADQPAGDGAPHLYAMNLATKRARQLGPPNLTGPPTYVPLAVMPDGRSVVMGVRVENLHRLMEVPLDGKPEARTLLTLTATPWYLDIGPDRSLYLEQTDRPVDLVHFSPRGGAMQHIATAAQTSNRQPLALPDGRFLLSAVIAGRSRLLVARPGQELTSFIGAEEESRAPMSLLGRDRVAFLLGNREAATIGIASAADGRVLGRVGGVPGGRIFSLAGSPDGKTIYYAAGGTIFSVAVAGGSPKKFTDGDSLAISPAGDYLVAKLDSQEGGRLMRVPLPGGESREIPFHSDLTLVPWPMSSAAIAPDGRILLAVSSNTSFYYGTAILDPARGTLQALPFEFGDFYGPGWTADGQVFCAAQPFKSSLWRFRPE